MHTYFVPFIDSAKSGKGLSIAARRGSQMEMEQLHIGTQEDMCMIQLKLISIRLGVYKRSVSKKLLQYRACNFHALNFQFSKFFVIFATENYKYLVECFDFNNKF